MIGHNLRLNSLLARIIEGKVEGGHTIVHETNNGRPQHKIILGIEEEG